MVDFEKLKFLLNVIPVEFTKTADARFKIEKAVSQAEKCTTVITGMPHGSGGFHSQVEDGAIRISELKEAYAESLNELERLREELKPLLPLIPVTHRAVIQLRYINGYSDAEISEAIGKSREQVGRYRREAQKMINDMGK